MHLIKKASKGRKKHS